MSSLPVAIGAKPLVKVGMGRREVTRNDDGRKVRKQTGERRHADERVMEAEGGLTGKTFDSKIINCF